MHALLVIYTIWLREFKAFIRERGRIIGMIGQPLLYLLIVGQGIASGMSLNRSADFDYLKYIYPGNLPGQVGEWENTRCHHCNATLIERYGFYVKKNRMQADGLCPDCHKPVPGIWGKSSGHGDGRVRPLL